MPHANVDLTPTKKFFAIRYCNFDVVVFGLFLADSLHDS